MGDSIIFLTEAGKNYGHGHLMRCMALAQGFKYRGFQPLFYLRGDYDAGDILKNFDLIQVEWLNENLDVSDKIVVLDSYYADASFCFKLYNQVKKILFIDDYNRIPYPGGYVLNSVINADAIDYPVNDKISYLLGPRFHPLREEFWDVPLKEINSNITKILITFGSSDITNETPEILGKLKQKYPDIEKYVIIGRGFSNIELIQSAADKNTSLIFYPDAKLMKELMLECDFVISAAGQTIAELARIGIPTYCIKVADNQEINIKNWMKLGFLLEEDVLFALPSLAVRQMSSTKGRSLIDGLGANRCVEILLND